MKSIERIIYVSTILAFLISCFYFRARFLETLEDYEIAKTENGRMAVILENENYNMQTSQKEITLLKDRSYSKYLLKPNKTGQTGLEATVYQSEVDGQVYCIVTTPFSLDRNLQYQLWGIKSGKYINAGVFQVGLTGLQKLLVMPLMDTFTITIEPIGKALQPTSKPIVDTEIIG